MKLNEIDLDKTLFVEHRDVDGLMPYILNKFFKINFTDSISTNYGELLELEPIKNNNYQNVIYIDFTPSESIRKIIEEKQMNVLILDHHLAVKEEIEEWLDMKIAKEIIEIFLGMSQFKKKVM